MATERVLLVGGLYGGTTIDFIGNPGINIAIHRPGEPMPTWRGDTTGMYTRHIDGTYHYVPSGCIGGVMLLLTDEAGKITGSVDLSA